MPAARQLLLVQNLHRKADLAADRRGPVGEDCRRQHVRRLVAEIPCDVARLAEDPAALHRALEARRVARPRVDDDRLFGRRAAALAALVGVAAVAGEDDALGEGLGGVGRRLQPAIEDGDPLQAALAGGQRRGPGDPAQPLQP